MPSHRHCVVCFDLGGVLVRICRSWAEAVTTAGLEARAPRDVHEAELIQRRRKLIDEHTTGALTNEGYYQAMSQAFGGLYTAAEMEQIHRAWTLDLYPGATDLVAELNELPHVVTACLSNTNDAHWQRLVGDEYAPICTLRHQLASHQLQVAKPHPEIYQRALGIFGVRPDDVIFFDDLAENVEAARQAGWHAEQVDPLADAAAQMRGHLRQYGVL
ncbi:MAG TPA: HAD family phosphatase [Polyangiaceae bacterium]|nr:HAD family phosphatase [Polyangiaceae bacterium]